MIIKKLGAKCGFKFLLMIVWATVSVFVLSSPVSAMHSARKRTKKSCSIIKLQKFENYAECWGAISEGIRVRGNQSEEQDPKFKDLQDLHVPQENLLSSPDKLADTGRIDWSQYNTVCGTSHFGVWNLYDIFHGITQFIAYNSEGKFNTSEIEAYFSGMDQYKNSSVSYRNQPNANNFDVSNIFLNSENEIINYFTLNAGRNPVIGLKLLNVEVQPIGYAVRCPGAIRGIGNSPVSFEFFGIDSDGKGTVLDERVNVNDLIKAGGYGFYYCRKTPQKFVGFALKFTEPSSNGFWIFNISKFEVHGIPYPRQNADLSLDFSELLDSDKVSNLDSQSYFQPDEYNPCVDMCDFL